MSCSLGFSCRDDVDDSLRVFEVEGAGLAVFQWAGVFVFGDGLSMVHVVEVFGHSGVDGAVDLDFGAGAIVVDDQEGSVLVDDEFPRLDEWHFDGCPHHGGADVSAFGVGVAGEESFQEFPHLRCSVPGGRSIRSFQVVPQAGQVMVSMMWRGLLRPWDRLRSRWTCQGSTYPHFQHFVMGSSTVVSMKGPRRRLSWSVMLPPTLLV